jgi:hypothetical protein
MAFGIFILNLILNNFFDFPRLWGQIPLGWIITVVLIIALNLHFVPLYWSKIKNWVRIKRGIRLPDKENYTCKSDYMLPFTGKWCVWEGGIIEKLSMDWDEPGDRFVYCFVVLDENGKDSLCYGKDILAVADGVVVKVSNHHSDSSDHKADESINYTGSWGLIGNDIIIRHNKNEYSCVGNLKRDSVGVKVGDKVKQGDVIAKCGNSGYTTEEPCLYFQLLSSKSFYLSTSLPVVFTNIKAEDSTAFGLAYENEREKPPSTKGNLEIIGNKTYIGRGLDVENGVLEA